MKTWLLKKMGAFLLFTWAAASLVFFLVHTIPGDPVAAMLGKMPHREDIRRLQQAMRLDRPLAEQYMHFMQKLLRLDLGESIIDHRPVLAAIRLYFPNTIILATAAMFLALLTAIPLGMLAAWKGKGVCYVLSMVFSTIGLAVPGFLSGILLIILFALRWHWLPVSGSGGVQFLILPALTLAISLSAFLTRVIQAAVAGEMDQPYVLLARAKGLSSFHVFFGHVLRNALIPVITIIGLQLGALLSGAIVIENVFSWPGIGTLLITAIRQRDFPLIQGIAIFLAVLYLLLNLLVDMTYPIIDPRLRHDRC
jgi:ABC-type dipeptide/oligopeptide/nickel transport system permease component